MLFSSAVFLWLFLPVVFVANYIIQPKYSNVLLLAASLLFYAWGEPVMVLLMLISILVNWLTGLGIERFPKWKKPVFLLGLLFNLGALGYYKYAGFLTEIINRVAGTEIFEKVSIALPIGISFFTFQAISYIADVYRGDTRAATKLTDIALYISFFPQLIAGPIVKYRDIAQQLTCRTFSSEQTAAGFRRFIYGLAKKVLIANVLGQTVDKVYGMDLAGIGGGMAWIASLCYMLQIYYDFSGYSDMAIGLGQMFGFHFPENFRLPYLSGSVREYWKRWHISLGSWFREYVYIPLGGNRKGTWRTYLNLLIVFFLTGLWHGASLTYIAWGLYNGFFILIERLGFDRWLGRHRILSHGYLLLMVNFGWVFFRLNSISGSLQVVKRMLLPWLYVGNDISPWLYLDWKTIFIFACAVMGVGLLQKAMPEQVALRWKGSVVEAVYCGALLLLCMAAIAGGSYNPFIYFQF